MPRRCGTLQLFGRLNSCPSEISKQISNIYEFSLLTLLRNSLILLLQKVRFRDSEHAWLGSPGACCATSHETQVSQHPQLIVPNRSPVFYPAILKNNILHNVGFCKSCLELHTVVLHMEHLPRALHTAGFLLMRLSALSQI